MTDQPRLSKSRFLSGSQCRLRLWHDFHAPHLADEAGDVLQAVFDTGHEVGELACRLYPGGHAVGHDHRHMEEAKNETRMVIEKGAASALYEAAFDYEGLFARADALRAIVDRLFDLHRVVRSTYYHPDFRGSFSLKNVLPVLSPDTGYGDLAIADGQKAAVQYSLTDVGSSRAQRAHTDNAISPPVVAHVTRWRRSSFVRRSRAWPSIGRVRVMRRQVRAHLMQALSRMRVRFGGLSARRTLLLRLRQPPL